MGLSHSLKQSSDYQVISGMDTLYIRLIDNQKIFEIHLYKENRLMAAAPPPIPTAPSPPPPPATHTQLCLIFVHKCNRGRSSEHSSLYCMIQSNVKHIQQMMLKSNSILCRRQYNYRRTEEWTGGCDYNIHVFSSKRVNAVNNL